VELPTEVHQRGPESEPVFGNDLSDEWWDRDVLEEDRQSTTVASLANINKGEEDGKLLTPPVSKAPIKSTKEKKKRNKEKVDNTTTSKLLVDMRTPITRQASRKPSKFRYDMDDFASHVIGIKRTQKNCFCHLLRGDNVIFLLL
jgi:hypothetical protein